MTGRKRRGTGFWHCRRVGAAAGGSLPVVEEVRLNVSALQHSLAAIPASAVMTSPVKTAYARWPLGRLVEFFRDNAISGAPVIASDGRLVGVVSLSDVVRRLGPSTPGSTAPVTGADCLVSDLMTPALIEVEPQTPLLEVVRLMHRRKIHRVFVVKAGRLMGVVSAGSFLGALLEEEQEAAA